MVFPGTVNLTGMIGAELYAVSTAASGSAGETNRITFNGCQWQDKLGAGSSGISIARMNVSEQVQESENTAGIGSVMGSTKGDYMENRNLILVITNAGEGEEPLNLTTSRDSGEPTEDTGTLDDTADLSDASLLATGPIEETINQSGRYYAVRVLSNPPGAMISVDYAYCGKTSPDTVEMLAAGNHTVSVEMPGFDPVEERITLTTNQTMTFDLETKGTSVLSADIIEDSMRSLLDQEMYGGVFVTSSPDEAIIYVDGKKTGFATPNIVYGLKAGKHTVQVKRVVTKTNDNQDPLRFTIDKKEVIVDNGVITPVAFWFFENTYLSQPVINSTTFNRTEFTVNGDCLKYHIPQQVKFQTTQNYITLHTGDAYISYTLFAENASEIWLEPRPYTLNDVWIESDPPGADIYVDGFATGLTTPYLVRNLSDQEHLLLVSKPGYFPIESTIRVTGTDLVRRFVLEPYLSGRLAIVSTPSGGKIYVNGKDTGQKTPYTFQYMSVGKYTIKVTQNQTKATIEGFMVEPDITNEANLTLKKKT
jgi:hypothetical protein